MTRGRAEGVALSCQFGNSLYFLAKVYSYIWVLQMASIESCLKDLFDSHMIDQAKLDQPCADSHLCKIADFIFRWEELAPHLSLNDVDIEDIKANRSPKLCKISMLQKWKRKKGRKATYRALAKKFVSQGRTDLAETLCEIIQRDRSSSSSDDDGDEVVKSKNSRKSMQSAIARYGSHLRSVYRVGPRHLLSTEFPPSPTRMIFNLALITDRSVRYGESFKRVLELLQEGKVEEIMAKKKQVLLEDIFKTEPHPGCPMLILFEGAPGAGKSTLAGFICQKWGSKELFQEFEIVIFVRLNDPNVQSARSLGDILHGSSPDTQQIVSSLKSKRGQGVLFVLDGWDEFAPQLDGESFIKQLICSPEDISMQLRSVIVTSRPVASGQLQHYCSSRIEILGFSPEELKHYFQEALENDSDSVAKLEQSLKEKSLIKKSCSLPLNAVIIAHIFLCTDGSLPATIHDVFRMLVHVTINRHMNKLGQNCSLALNDKDYLKKLPSHFQDCYDNLCKLAYDGVKKNSTTFFVSDLEAHGISSSNEMLSLLQGVSSLTSSGQTTFYSFYHLTLQELLATHFILKLPIDEQFEAFKPLFGQPRFVAVFQFYTSQLQLLDQYASRFCHFLSDVYQQVRLHVDQQSERHPEKWQGDLKSLECNAEGLHSEFVPVNPNDVPIALSSFDLVHYVLYCPLPYLDVGYMLLTISVSRNGEVKFDFCACVRDDVMMYGHVSGIQLLSVSAPPQASSISKSQTPPPHLYFSYVASDSESNEFFEYLPQWCSIIKDQFLLMAYISPLCLLIKHYRDVDYGSVANDVDVGNIFIAYNTTRGVQRNRIMQEFENFSEQCKFQ